jgi:hypothetical protein
MLKVFLITLVLSVASFGEMLYNAPILKTGQTTVYTKYDDGYYQAGVARDYNRSSKGVVTDKVTGLQWQDNNDSVLRKWEDGGSFPAAEYCSALSLDGGDWQLPTIRELLTLADVSQYDPSITDGVFKHISSNNYWSSTTHKDGTNGAWIVDFYGGHPGYNDKDNGNYVRCVRDGHLEPSNFDRNDTTEIVTDNTTGLQWQDDDAVIDDDVNWTAAIDYCENVLDLGGYSDWRLPNRNELLSIIDYSQSGAAIDPEFVNRTWNKYWSSTTSVGNADNAWYVDFYYGSSRYYNKDYDFYVRCVRGGQVNTSTFNPSIIMYLLN